jgi:hypothetical protein
LRIGSREGACAPGHDAFVERLLHRHANLLHVDAFVLPERAVFGGQHRPFEIG